MGVTKQGVTQSGVRQATPSLHMRHTHGYLLVAMFVSDVIFT